MAPAGVSMAQPTTEEILRWMNLANDPNGAGSNQTWDTAATDSKFAPMKWTPGSLDQLWGSDLGGFKGEQGANMSGLVPGSPETAAALRKLGYQGDVYGSQDTGYNGGSEPGTFGTMPSYQTWSPEVRQWMAQNGITVGTSQTGEGQQRATSYGLLDKNGQYIQGQGAPTDVLRGNPNTEFLQALAMMAGPVYGAVSGAGALAEGGAGLAPQATGGSTLAPSSYGVTPLTQESLALAPSGVSDATLSYINGSIPTGNVGAFDGLLGSVESGAIKGGIGGGVKGLISGQNPLESALKGAAFGAIGGGITGGVNMVNPDGAGLVNGGISGAIKAGIGGGNPLIGALGGAAQGLGQQSGGLMNTLTGGGYSGAGSAIQDSFADMPAGGNNMDFGDWGTGGFDPFGANNPISTTDWGQGGFDPFGPNSGIGGAGNFGGWGTGGFDPFGATSDPSQGGSSWLNDLLSGAGSLIKPIAGAVGGGKNLAALVGAGLGLAGSGKSTTATTQQQIDPRMAAYLYGSSHNDPNSFLGSASNLYQANKSGMNSTMQQGLDMQRSALLDPAYGQAYTQMRDMGSRLMQQPIAGNPFATGQMQLPQVSQPQQPTAQAGGPGGLLGLLGPNAKNMMMPPRNVGLIG